MFADTVVAWVNLVLLAGVMLTESIAIIHCALQRPDAFPAIGTMSKGTWLAVLFGTLLFTALFFWYLPWLGLLAVVAPTVYLVDVRPSIRDIGSTSW